MDLTAYYTSSEIAADGQAIFSHAAGDPESGDGYDVIQWADSDTPTSDELVGVLGWFDADTASAELRNLPFTIKSNTASELTLFRPLPVQPTSSDYFMLLRPGAYTTADEIPYVFVNGELPERILYSASAVEGVEIVTGCNVLKAYTGAEVLYLKWINALDEMSLSDDGVTYGESQDISVSGGDVFVFHTADDESWVEIEITDYNLGGADTVYALVIVPFKNNLLPDGHEEEVADDGCQKLSVEVIKNTGTKTVVDADYFPVMTDRSATLTTAFTGRDAGTVDVNSMLGWPTRNFWIYDETVDTLRHVNYRSGNRLYVSQAHWGYIDIENGVWPVEVGDELTTDRGDTLEVVGVDLTSGSWSGGDAVATIWFKDIVVAAGVMLEVYLDLVLVGDVTSYGFEMRGYTTQNLGIGDTIRLYPLFDLAVIAVGSSGWPTSPSIYEMPDVDLVSFDQWTYTAGALQGIALGSLVVAEEVAVYRKTIMIPLSRGYAPQEMDSRVTYFLSP